jgi:hypothetical protein
MWQRGGSQCRIGEWGWGRIEIGGYTLSRKYQEWINRDNVVIVRQLPGSAEVAERSGPSMYLADNMGTTTTTGIVSGLVSSLLLTPTIMSEVCFVYLCFRLIIDASVLVIAPPPKLIAVG